MSDLPTKPCGVRVEVTGRDASVKVVQAEAGLSLMEAIREAGIDALMAMCGGCCSCATCHVHIDPAWVAVLPPVGDDESGLLDYSSHRDAFSRLSCQIFLTAPMDGLAVRIAKED